MNSFSNKNEPKIISNGINYTQHVFVYTKLNTLYSFGHNNKGQLA